MSTSVTHPGRFRRLRVPALAWLGAGLADFAAAIAETWRDMRETAAWHIADLRAPRRSAASVLDAAVARLDLATAQLGETLDRIAASPAAVHSREDS